MYETKQSLMTGRTAAKLFFIVFMGLFAQAIKAQEVFSKVTSDFESWNSLRLKKEVSKRFSIGIEQGFRFNEDAQSLNQALSEIELDYKLSKSFGLALGNRYIYDRTKSGNFENNYRLHLDAYYKQDVSRFDFKFRLRYQNKMEINLGQENVDDRQPYFRLKLQSKYNIRNWKLDPEFSAELFKNLETGGQVDLIRFTIGAEYKIKKIGKIGAFYRIENELNTILPKATYIMGLKYSYTFKANKK